MAKVESKIIDKNSLRFGAYKPKDLYFNGEVNRAVWNGEVKFNRAMYRIEIGDTELPIEIDPAGDDLYNRLNSQISRKEDLADNVITDVPYTIDYPIVEPNTDETKGRNGFFTITQDVSGLTLQGMWTQLADYVIGAGVKDKVLHPMYSQASAAGGFVSLATNPTGVSFEQWASGKPSKEESWKPENVVVNRVKGTVWVDGATLDPITGGLYAPNRGTNNNNTEDPDLRVLATVTYVKVTADEEEVEWEGSIDIEQQDNIPRDTTEYDVSSTASPDPSVDKVIPAEGGVIEIRGTALVRTNYDYPSGEELEGDWENSVLHVSSNVGTFNDGKNTLSGSDDVVVLTVGQASDDRNITINVNNALAYYNVDYKYTQTAKTFVGYNTYGGFSYAMVSYLQADAGYSTVSPVVVVYVKMYATYSDGTHDADNYIEEPNYTAVVTSASSEEADKYDSGATLNRNNGNVTVQSLGTDWWYDPHAVFEVNSMSGTFNDDERWTWNGVALVEQSANIREDGELEIYRSASLLNDVLEGGNSIIEVYYEGYTTQHYIWSSGAPDSSTTYEPVTITVKGPGVDLMQTPRDGSGIAEFDVGNTGESRTFAVKAVDKNGNVLLNETVEQTVRTFHHYRLGWYNVKGVSYDEVFAYGGVSEPSIAIEAYVYAVYSDGTEDADPIRGNVRIVSVDTAGGSPENSSGATINTSTGVVSVNRLPMSESDAQSVFRVTSLEGTFYLDETENWHEWEWSGEAYVEQAENRYNRVTDPVVVLNSTAPQSPVDAVDTSIIVYGNAYKESNWAWDSHPEQQYWEPERSNLTLYVTLNGNSGSMQQISGKNESVWFAIGENESLSSKTYTIQVYNSSEGYSEEYTVVQNAAVYVFKQDVNTLIVGASGGTATLYFTSTVNGRAYPLAKSAFSVTGATGTSVSNPVSAGSKTGYYKVDISIPKNSDDARNFVVKALHPVLPSTDALTWTINQEAQAVETKKIAKYGGTFSFSTSGYSQILANNACLSAVGDDYTGGTVYNLYFRVVGSKNGMEYGKTRTFDSVTVADESTTRVQILGIDNTSGSSDVYVEMWYNDAMQEEIPVMLDPGGATSLD